MAEAKERTSEELQELRREGVAPHSPVATRLLVSSSVLVVAVLVVKDIKLHGSSVLELTSVLGHLGTGLIVTAAVSLAVGLLSPLVQRSGLMRAGLLKPKLRPFPGRVAISLQILGCLVAIVAAGFMGYRFAGALLSLGALRKPVAFEQLGLIVATEARWLAFVCGLIGIVAAVLARVRFLRGRG